MTPINQPSAEQIVAFQAKLEADMPKAGDLVHEAVSKALSSELLPAATTVALIVGAVNLTTTLVLSQNGGPEQIKKMVQDLVDKALLNIEDNIATIKATLDKGETVPA